MLLPQDDPIVIVSHARTPMGGLQGELSSLPASRLGAAAIKGAVDRAGVEGSEIDEVLMGCVLPAGQGQAPARQAAIHAGLPTSVPCTTVNKMCGSGMKTIMMLAQAIAAGSVKIGVAGGMESMSNAPYLLPKARSGYRMGHGQVIDHMFFDGLEDAYEGGLMGTFAELCADKYEFSREAQDEYAIASLDRAIAASEEQFTDEIVGVTVESRSGSATYTKDEQPFKARPEKIPTLKPAFRRDGGTVTAANASSISDGAAALVLMRKSEADARGLSPIAKLTGMTSHAQEPAWFTTAPVGALQNLFDAEGTSQSDYDLFEVNEAFAVVPMAAMEELGIKHNRMNVNGGACALGHPIGASGARIVSGLVNALKHRGLSRGAAGICIGGGEATAVGVELL
ncbi:acetyl-CoA C-acyltransferase [Parvularcula sp. ZS-1/3]|uniref:Acetyl-CoA C-acyltransferase n=1 Tax=Parvularcula mediterranea TaxID=2732508 RepID=A0A7Y3RKP8_9PROT|nr:acetyl-CoA C-acyltransferase [Parvularcula mediterranea]NNU15826.1 acetyl-CoA C-acyltransferase [Parvularcula mediterranea]